MQNSDYPALFRSADHTSNNRQRLHLGLIKSEYAFLILAAIFSMSFFQGTFFYALYACLFAVLAGILITRAYLKPVQSWYKARALAESVKTLAWRFMMSAPPFDEKNDRKSASIEFSEHLRQLLRATHGDALLDAPDFADVDQITKEMKRVRELSFLEKSDFYRTYRIHEQRGWYARKARRNRFNAGLWVAFGVGSYVLAGILVFFRIFFPEWWFWPIEPIIVFASSVVGWMQLKKFGELAMSYQIAAQEIGLLEPILDECADPTAFGLFVNDAELAFSREHTMWVARQTS